jgi:hypothetical protein
MVIDRPTYNSNSNKSWVDALVEKRAFIRLINPQTIRSAVKGSISPGSIENMGQGALVPVQMGPLVPVCATNRH